MPDTKEIASLVKMLQSKYGEGAIGLLGSMKAVNVRAVSTGIPDLDYALGVGGVPYGRIIEIYGPESSGKTTVAECILASEQRHGGTVAFIDVEHSFDPMRAKVLGLDIDKLIFSQPDTAEEALDMVIDLAATGKVSFIVLDSVAALLPKEEEDKDMDKNTVGLQARLLSKFCRKAKGILNMNGCGLIVINQIREKVGIMFGSKYICNI